MTISHRGRLSHSRTAALARTQGRGDAVGNYEVHLGQAERIALAMAPKPQEPEHERARKLRARITLRKFSWENKS